MGEPEVSRSDEQHLVDQRRVERAWRRGRGRKSGRHRGRRRRDRESYDSRTEGRTQPLGVHGQPEYDVLAVHRPVGTGHNAARV